MKKIKCFSWVLLILLLFTTGCFKRDGLEGVEIMTTVYPIEYVTNYLYGEHSTVNSVYPDDIDTFTYHLSKKQISDYSKKKLFIYNRITDDKDIALAFLEKNQNMLIIDATYGMDITYGIEELWLNPSNLLMITQNIKNGLEEYLTNSFLEKEIDKQYEKIKVLLSELDAELKLTAENATTKTIVVNNDSLKFLEKYGFEVISLDDTAAPVNEKIKDDVVERIRNQEIKHIFLLENTNNTETTDEIINKTNVDISTFRRLDSITDQERDEKTDYFIIMNSNIELLRDELY